MTDKPITASQGFAYLYDGEKVIALSNGPIVKILFFNEARPWEGKTLVVPAKYLQPQPSRYLHGQVPQ